MQRTSILVSNLSTYARAQTLLQHKLSKNKQLAQVHSLDMFDSAPKQILFSEPKQGQTERQLTMHPSE